MCIRDRECLLWWDFLKMWKQITMGSTATTFSKSPTTEDTPMPKNSRMISQEMCIRDRFAYWTEDEFVSVISSMAQEWIERR